MYEWTPIVALSVLCCVFKFYLVELKVLVPNELISSADSSEARCNFAFWSKFEVMENIEIFDIFRLFFLRILSYRSTTNLINN